MKNKVMRGTYLRTGQQYAIKVLDKGHLKRKQKMDTALAEKNALVTLGAGHPGIVRLYYAFHDEWSLCKLNPFAEGMSIFIRAQIL
jgi:3-phosphoinositide dependent protein kinase-1